MEMGQSGTKQKDQDDAEGETLIFFKKSNLCSTGFPCCCFSFPLEQNLFKFNYYPTNIACAHLVVSKQ